MTSKMSGLILLRDDGVVASFSLVALPSLGAWYAERGD